MLSWKVNIEINQHNNNLRRAFSNGNIIMVIALFTFGYIAQQFAPSWETLYSPAPLIIPQQCIFLM